MYVGVFPEPPPPDSPHTLGGGAIAGIAVGVAVCVIVGVLVLYWVVERRNRNLADPNWPYDTPSGQASYDAQISSASVSTSE